MFFSLTQITGVSKAFSYAEELVSRHFRLSRDGMKANRYDVRTRAALQEHEVHDSAFAHLCKYYCQKTAEEGHPSNFHFFRICLQDDRILDAMSRARSFIKFSPLMLYIATHELVHIVRFNRGDSDFDAPSEAKATEEDKVNSITRSILKPSSGVDMALVIDCFSNQYKIDAFSLPEQ